MPKTNPLYTTVTLSDFKDSEYIHSLINLNIGMELALLTKIPLELNTLTHPHEISALKQEILAFKDAFEKYRIPLNKIRIHQPGGYMYHWSSRNGISGFDVLKEFFSYCLTLGFKNYIIHAPYGSAPTNKGIELAEFREKLQNLVPNANLEVEEIATSNHKLKNIEGIRFYEDTLLEQLLQETAATILLDTYECGGVKPTIRRLEQLKSRGFEVKSLHLHKNKHQLLTNTEVGKLLTSQFTGNLINEGFISRNSSFEEFIKTKSHDCIVSNKEKIETLKSWS